MHYYEKLDGSEKGQINLEEALSVTKKSDPHKNYTFQINTPNRIYYLHTDSEGSVAYWVNGVSAILSSIKQQDEGKAGRYSIKMQITDNKVTDLENEVQKLKKALDAAAKALRTTSAEIIRKAQAGEEISAPIQGNRAGSAASAQPASQFKARALFDYTPSQEYELKLRVGEEIFVLSKHQNGWWLGCNPTGTQGYFPASYVTPLK